MSDNYEFEKSRIPQGISQESPYVRKDWQYVNDINGSVYSSQGTALVQFDLSSIYNSSQLIDISQAFITIPIVYSSAYTSNTANGALVAPTAGNGWANTGLKSGYFQLVHAADLQVNGKQIEQYQPYLNSYVSFKMLSELDQDSYNAFGVSLGMGRQLDNFQSIRYNGTSTLSANAATAYPAAPNVIPVTGNGVTNNVPFSLGTADFGDEAALGAQFTGCYNNGLYSRLIKPVDLTGGQATNLYGNSATANIMSSSNLNNEFKSTYQVLNTNYGVWYDTAIVRVQDILNSMKHWPLSKKFDGVLKLYLNVGAVGSLCTGANGAMVSSLASNTFTNTCPLMQTALSALPATTTGIVSGISIAKAGPTNIFGGVNLALSNGAHPMTACRFYYPAVVMKPEESISYIRENRAKKVCFTSVLTNVINGVTAASSYSQLIQSGVTGIRGLLICPFISGTVNGLPTTANTNLTGVTSFSQLLSPFDSAPATTAPISLTNLQVTIGGQNVKQSTLFYTYENFLEEVSLYEKLNGSDFGLSTGLLSQFAWEQSRWYYIDCTRGEKADQLTPRNIVLSFNNNTLQTCDYIVFTERFEEVVVDVESGIVTK
jgi:hypothetical protein